MSEHTPDSNAEFLRRHPDAEPDPDRANTAAYARKKIEDLIEIAKANNQNEVEVSLEIAADAQEQTEVAEYDTMEQGRRDLIENFVRGLVELARGGRSTTIERFDSIKNPIVHESMTKFIKYIRAEPIANVYVNDNEFYKEGQSVKDILTSFAGSSFLAEKAVKPVQAWTIYSTAYPDINLVVGSKKSDKGGLEDFTGHTELTLVTREVTDRLLQNTDSDRLDRT